MAKQDTDEPSLVWFYGGLLVLGALGEIVGALITGALVIGGIVFVWTVGSEIIKQLFTYYKTPTTIKSIDKELGKIATHKKLLSTKIKALETENEGFNKRKETEASTPTTIRLVEAQIQQRQQRIGLFNSILSLHEKRVQKLSIFKKEYLLLRDITLSNQQHEVSSSDATQQYADLVNNIDLNIKYDYTEKMDQLVRNLSSGFSQQDTNAAITHLTEIIQEEIDRDQLYKQIQPVDKSIQIDTQTEQLILNDLYQLRLQAKNIAIT